MLLSDLPIAISAQAAMAAQASAAKPTICRRLRGLTISP